MNVTKDIQQDYLHWKRGDIITISAGTGKGKSHFVKNSLYNHAKSKDKRILFFLHRTNTIDQFEEELRAEGKLDVIDLITYQGFEQAIIRKNQIDLWFYDYIICDEYHYFGNDSPFNCYTDLSLNKILDGANECTLLLMSATNNFIKSYLSEHRAIKTKEYSIPTSYEYIKNLEFFDDEQYLIEGLKKLKEEGKKALVFIESATECYELYKQFEDVSLFICGSSHKKYKHVDKEKRQELLINQKFDEQFLFATQVLDAGLNIIDPKLNIVIVDIADPDVLVQCVGRKRVQSDEDYIHLVVRNRSNAKLGRDKANITERLKHIRYLKEYGESSYQKGFYRVTDPYKLVYFEPLSNGVYELRTNELLFESYQYKYRLLDEIQDMAGGYRQYIVELFDKKGSIYMDSYLEPETHLALEEAFQNGNQFYSQKQKSEFATRLNLKTNGRLIRSFRKINEQLTLKEASYRIFQFDTKLNGKRYKTAWKIIEIPK